VSRGVLAKWRIRPMHSGRRNNNRPPHSGFSIAFFRLLIMRSATFRGPSRFNPTHHRLRPPAALAHSITLSAWLRSLFRMLKLS